MTIDPMLENKFQLLDVSTYVILRIDRLEQK